MSYVCGCDVGSTCGKAVIMNEEGEMLSSAIISSRLDPEMTALDAVKEAICRIKPDGSISEIAYTVGTGYGGRQVPFANENISEISCHGLGVFVTDPAIHTILDIGGQDIKAISLDERGEIANFVMNDKCAAGTGRFFENISRVFGMGVEQFSKLSLRADDEINITSQCTVFAETEVISLIAKKQRPENIAAGIEKSVARRCYTLLLKVGLEADLTITGGCAKNKGLIQAMEAVAHETVHELPTDPQLMGAIGACEFARRKMIGVR